VQLFTPKKEQDTLGIIYSFLGLVKRSANEPIQASYPRAKIPYLSLLIILALINQPYLESLPSEVIVTSKPMDFLVKGNPYQSIKNGTAIFSRLLTVSFACNGALNKYQDT
jgi:hypothetical protein